MKKRNLILASAVAAALVSTVVQAGSVAPILASAISYATEGVNAGPLTLTAIVYTMGVSRTAGQDMTILFDLPAGTTFATVPTSLGYTGAASTATIALKRGGVGSSQVVYSIAVTGAGVAATNTFTLSTATLTTGTHGMTTAGSNLNLKVTLLDQVETACVDNAGVPTTCFVTAVPAKLANAVDFFNTVVPAVGVASDTGTTTNVNATVPLAGFVVQNDDTATVASATVQVRTTVATVKAVDATTDFTAGAADVVTVTVTDPTGFLGLATNGFYYDLDASGAATGTALTGPEVFNISGNVGTRTIPGNTVGVNTNKLIRFTSNGTTPMGTSRVLQISGGVAPVAGIAHAFTGNNTWWSWNSNGTILETPFFSNAPGFNNRFSFMNYGTSDVTYSTQCLVEPGKTATPVVAAVGLNGSTGTLKAGAHTVITSTSICSVSGTTTGTGNTAARGAIRFTINAPSTVVKGVYNSVNSSTGAVDSVELLRPTLNANQF